MNPRELFARHTTAEALAPLLGRVLPEDMLADLASVPEDESLAPLPAELRAAHALRDPQDTPAVLYALEHILKPELEEVRGCPLERLQSEYTLYELLERRRPARTILALQLDGRDAVQDLGLRLLAEIDGMRRRLSERQPQSTPAPVVQAAMAAELHDLAEENAQLLERLDTLEANVVAAPEVVVAPKPQPQAEPEPEVVPEPESEAPAPDWRSFLEREEPAESDSIDAMLAAVEDELPEEESSPEDALAVAHQAPESEVEAVVETADEAEVEAPAPEPPPPPKAHPAVLRGRTVVLLGGNARRGADYERMLRELGAHPRHAPEPDLLEENAPLALLDDAHLVVALGDTLFDATAERILERAAGNSIPNFRYHSTAVEGVRHFLLSLAEKGHL